MFRRTSCDCIVIVLGIDPSSTSTGYGLVERCRRQHRYVGCGCVRPPLSASLGDRLVFLFDHLVQVLEEAQPDEVAIESSFYGRDADAVGKLGEARGVIRLAVRRANLVAVEYPPAQVKKAVVGTGQATKEQVQFMVMRRLHMSDPPRSLDASDALAVALCHLQRDGCRAAGPTTRRRPEVEALLARVSTR